MEDFATLTSLDFLNISGDISALWAHGSISLDVNKANGMLAGNATRIFCNTSSATMSHALEQIPARTRLLSFERKITQDD